MAAKNKKHTKRKPAAAVAQERSPFWGFAGATLLCLSALFLLLGGFDTGGPLPVNVFHGAYVLLGWAAYLMPVALLYWGGIKFASEDHRLSAGKFAGMAST